MIFVSIVLPILAGILLLIAPDRIFKSRQMLINMTAVSFVVCALFPVLVICRSAGNTLLLFSLVDEIPVFFAVDTIGKIFAGIVIFVFLMAGFFSFVYMSHEHHEKRYYGFYLITFGVLMGLCFSGNLVTLYLFYEFMTLVSVPLVLHSGSKEAVMAGLKYLFYSFCGAYMALFGIYFLYKYAIAFNGGYETSGHMLGFVAGGSLDLKAVDCGLWREGRVFPAPCVASYGASSRAGAGLGVSVGHYRESGRARHYQNGILCGGCSVFARDMGPDGVGGFCHCDDFDGFLTCL